MACPMQVMTSLQRLPLGLTPNDRCIKVIDESILTPFFVDSIAFCGVQLWQALNFNSYLKKDARIYKTKILPTCKNTRCSNDAEITKLKHVARATCALMCTIINIFKGSHSAVIKISSPPKSFTFRKSLSCFVEFHLILVSYSSSRRSCSGNQHTFENKLHAGLQVTRNSWQMCLKIILNPIIYIF